MKIKVLYEDKDILAIDKPSGIFVYLYKKTKDKTILDWALKNYPKTELVHRLDRETSGVMLLAKNQKAHAFLKKQFSAPALEMRNRGLADRQDRTKKAYVAVVNGWVKNDHGIINKPIGRSPRDFRRHLAGRGARGELREAITEYKVLKRFTSPRPSPYKGEGEKYILNLIDTPGHVDFSYEVSRALKAVEGSILLIDSTQGVQAQTLTTLAMARGDSLEGQRKIIPVISKIDSPLARISEVGEEVVGGGEYW